MSLLRRQISVEGTSHFPEITGISCRGQFDSLVSAPFTTLQEEKGQSANFNLNSFIKSIKHDDIESTVVLGLGQILGMF